MEFWILGPLEAWSEGRRLPLGGPRSEAVMAMLVLEAGHTVPVARLVDAAWDANPPATAAHQVRKIVADLRRRLPDGPRLIVTDGSGYRVVLADTQRDLGVFDARMRRARAAGGREEVMAELRAALDLWRGPALDGLGTPVIRAAAAVLEERRLAAADQLGRLRLEAGQSAELVADLRSLLAEEPLRETTRAQLMLALYRSGRHAEALRVYEEGRRLLAAELGIDPGPQMLRLYEQMLRGDPELAVPGGPAGREPLADPGAGAGPPEPVGSPRPVPPPALPYDIADFVGRRADLALIAERARGGDRPGLVIVTIDGMAGVGKTALMVHAGHQLAADFPDGQLFVDLRGFSAGREPMQPAEALDVLLRESGMPSEQVADDVMARAAQWRAQAAGRRLLVLLDNAAETGQVRPLLPGAPGCLVMITSRSRLTGLDGTLSLSLEPPPLEEGVQLVTRILGAERVAGAGADAEALVRACDRLPLAIRIASARLHNRPQWSLRYLVERLEDGGRQLAELAIDDRSVAAAIGLSYDSLGPDHQRMFLLLGLVPDTEFDAYAAAALAEVPLSKAELLLEDLLDVRLIVQRTRGRYTFHDIVRGFARDGDVGSERGTAMHRLFDYYLRAADAAADLVQPGRVSSRLDYRYPPADLPQLADRAAAMAWFDRECTGLISAVHGARANGLDEHACHLARSLAYYLQLRGRMADLMAVQEVAVAAARRIGERRLEGRSLINLSLPLWHFGRFSEALDRARQAMVIAEEVGDLPGLGMSLGRIGLLLSSLGDYREALGYLDGALATYEQAGIRRERGRTLSSVSVARSALGRHEEALAAAVQAVEIDRAVGDRASEVIGLANVATAEIGLGRLDAAEATLGTAAELVGDLGTPNGEAVVLAVRADLLRRLGRYDEAVDSGRQALRILRTINRPAVAAAVENTLGLVASARGDHALALDWHARAGDRAQAVGFRIELARSLAGRAAAAAALGRPDAAVAQWEQALAHYVDMGVPEAGAVRRNLMFARPR